MVVRRHPLDGFAIVAVLLSATQACDSAERGGGGEEPMIASTPADGAAPVASRGGSTVLGNASVPQGTWAIAETPTLSIGGGDSGPASDLYSIRGALRLGDGRVVIVDGAPRVLVFGADGRHLRTFSRGGEGPGELRIPTWLQRLPGDTLVVFDQGNGRRLSYFTVDGTFVRSVRSSLVPPPTFVGVLPDGTLLATKDLPAVNVTYNQVGLLRTSMALLRLDNSAAVLDSLGTIPGIEGLDGRGIEGGFVLGFGGPDSPFRNTVIKPGDRVVYVATGDRFEVMAFSLEGGSPQVLQREYELTPLSLEDLVEYLSRSSGARGMPVEAIRSWPEGQTRPAITALLVDDVGNVWAEEGRTDRAAPATWSVFDASGTYSASVTAPPRFQLSHVGAESVLGVWRDELNVEYVQVRSIVRH